MASLIKDKLRSATGHGSDDIEAKREAEKYRLQVTAGGSYDKSTHRSVAVNSGHATYIENAHLRAKVQVRVRDYKGFPSTSTPSSPYFDDQSHAKDQYSIAFSFVPKHDIPSCHAIWGNDFDHPVRERLPPGFNTAFKIVKEFIDPGLSCDAYADEPWLYGPALSSWFAFIIGEEIGQDGDFPAPKENVAMAEGGNGSGNEVRQKLGLPENNEKRRKHFLSAAHREAFTFEAGRLYAADFYNPYIDFGNFALKLPGFSLKVVKYIDEKSHCLRYVFKDRESGEVYVNINFELLMGREVDEALDRENRGSQELAETQSSVRIAHGMEVSSAATAVRDEPSLALGSRQTYGDLQTSTSATDVLPAPQAEPVSALNELRGAAPTHSSLTSPSNHLHLSQPDSESQTSALRSTKSPATAGKPCSSAFDVSTASSSRKGEQQAIAETGELCETTADALSDSHAVPDPTLIGHSQTTALPAEHGIDEISRLLEGSATSDRRGDARGIL